MADKPLLSPEELDALAASLDSGSIEVDTGFNTGAKVRKHDLASEDSSLGVNISSIDMINERFIRQFRLGLLEVLRTSPRINPTRVQILRFGDYLKMLKAPLSVNIMRANPLRGYTMVVIEPTVVFSSLDSFFGGFGRGVGDLPPGRMFTPTETRIIRLILDVFTRSLKDAWAPIYEVDFEHVSSEINPQFAQIADENDLVILSRFDAEPTSQGKGFIDLVYPYAALKPIRDLLRSRVQSGDGNEESDKQWRSDLENAVNDSSVEMQFLLGHLNIALSQLESMKEGDVLYFKKPDMARVYISDLPSFDVEIGSVGSNIAAKIVAPVNPSLLEANAKHYRRKTAMSDENSENAMVEKETINPDVLENIPVTLSIEVGRAVIKIRDLMRLTQGSVVELDRIAGEPLDLLVNNTVVAQGEVVLVNDRYGIRLTRVVPASERMKNL